MELTHPPLRGLVPVLGSDAGGREAVAEAIVAAARQRGPVKLLRWREGTGGFAARWRGALRYLVTWASARRSRGVVVLVGGWHDALLRHTTQARRDRPVPWVSMLMPRAAAVVLVDRGPRPIRPSPDAPEWARWAWRELAPWIARRAVEVDLDLPGAAEAGADQLMKGEDAPTGSRWVRPPASRRERSLLATTGRGAWPALGMYGPRRPVARLAVATNRVAAAGRIALPALEPVDDLDGLCALLGLDAAGMATIRTKAPGRRLLGVAGDDRLLAVMKIGPPGDVGLRREADVLRRLDGGGEELVVPRLRWSGMWSSRFVLVTDALPNRGVPQRIDVRRMAEICVTLARGLGSGPIVHGDLAPWNLLELPDGRPGVVDWENARFELDPLYDLVHFVVQSGMVLRRCRPRDAVAELTWPGSPGWWYLEQIGRDPRSAPDLVRSYLRRAGASGPYPRKVLDLLGPPDAPCATVLQD